MKLRKIIFFTKIVWRNWYYKGIDKWHPFKYRIDIKTAWRVAKVLYG